MTNSQKTPLIRLGVIGAGVMAQWAIYPSLYTAPFELIAVCDLDAERASDVARKYGARAYTDYQAMWQQETLDALIIQMHPLPRHALVLEALAAGYDLFVPKPPAMSYAQTVELADAAQRHGRKLMVNFESRFSAGIREAQAIMAQDSFGQLTQLSCSFCTGSYADPQRNRDYDDPIHAYVLDFTVHHLDLARYLAGEVAEMSLYHQTIDDRVALSVAAKFESGTVGTFQFNSQRIWWRNYDHIELTGQGEYIVLDGLWSSKHYTEQGNHFTENYRDQRSIELTGDAYALIEFASAIREEREPIASIRDCVGTMRLYQGIYDAVVAGREGVVALG